VSVGVAQLAAGDDPHPEGQRVEVEHPLGGRQIRAQVFLDLGKHRRDPDEVHADHQGRSARGNDRQCRAAAQGEVRFGTGRSTHPGFRRYPLGRRDSALGVSRRLAAGAFLPHRPEGTVGDPRGGQS